MQLFISVLRPGEADAAARDLLVVAPEDATVGDMVAGLEPAVEGSDPGAALRLVVNAGEQVGAPPMGVWDGPRRLAPADNLVDVVRNGMLLGLGGPVRDDAEPVGVVELRVVAGQGAGAVHRLSLGGYTLGGPGCDLVLEGVEGRIADLAVAVECDDLLPVEVRIVLDKLARLLILRIVAILDVRRAVVDLLHEMERQRHAPTKDLTAPNARRITVVVLAEAVDTIGADIRIRQMRIVKVAVA